MATLSSSFHQTAESPAIIIPSKPNALTLSYKQLALHIASLQKQLADLGVAPHSAVSIALPNSLEFITVFLAVAYQRAIAAPLNPAYKQAEFEFYIEDLKSAVAIVPRGAFESNSPAVRAARKFRAAIAECYWDTERDELILDVKDKGALQSAQKHDVQRAQPDDIALVLHTSGTTGRPKAVCYLVNSLTAVN
jgi:oxalate---CoA ligase